MIENLIREYGLWAVFFGVMIEGDLTLLFAGVLAHYGLFSFSEALITGMLGGFAGDSLSWLLGHTGKRTICNSRFYQQAQPRLQKLCDRFGIFSVFVVKYIYGLRTASAVFYGFAPMKYRRFAPLTLLSCALWALVLTGLGYSFSGAIGILIGRVQQAGIILLIALLIAVGILGLIYLLERFVIAPQVPELEPQMFNKSLRHSFDQNAPLNEQSEVSDHLPEKQVSSAHHQ
jgi:membrane protein DedA with SNARE-associated domain